MLIVDTGKPAPRGYDTESHAGLLGFEFGQGRDRLIVNCGAAGSMGAEWRMACAAAGIPGVAVALLIRLIVREPPRRYWAAERPIREARREAVCRAAAATIGQLTTRELLVAGAIAYWCEGTKNKPHRQVDRVTFINSDPSLILFFMRFLDAAGTLRANLVFRVYIHETADVVGAQKFWLDVTGAAAGQFRAPTLKHHNPKTIRKNVGESYHGCLRIDVRDSADLYRRIEGWATAITNPSVMLDDQDANPVEVLPGKDLNLH